MNEHVSDMELERYLRRRDRVSQEYAALGSEGPPAELDALVLERARRALDEDAHGSFWRRANWPRITALAATVVLSFALVVRLAIDRQMPVPAAAPTAMEAELASVDGSESKRQVAPSDDLRIGGRDDGAGVARIETNSAFAAPPATPAPDAPQAMTRQKSTSSVRAAPMPAPVASEARPSPGEGPQSSEEPSDTAATSIAAQKQEADLARLGDEVRARTERREAALMKSAAEADETASAQTQEQRAAALKSVTVTGHRVGAGHLEAPMATSAAMSPDSGAGADAERDPKEWFEEIRYLRAEGRTEEADREMEKLRAAHPDFEPAKEQAPKR